jgi:hypothetical protein
MLTHVRFAILALVTLLLPLLAYIDVHRPATLGAMSKRAQSITVMKATKVFKEDSRGAVIYETIKKLKGELPTDTLRQVFARAHEAHELKTLLAWAKEGAQVVVFRYENRLAIYHGGIWSVTDTSPPEDRKQPWAFESRTEPAFLQSYCGQVEKFADLVADLLADKEITVNIMLGERDKQLRKRTGDIVTVRASLKLQSFDLKTQQVK